MTMSPVLLLRLTWGLWGLSWIAAALWSAPTVKRGSPAAIWLYRAAMALGFGLLFGGTAWLHAARLWQVGYGGGFVLVALTAPGFAFMWWARLHLGRLWSSAVTRKEGHYLVDTGPYAVVRHPIYTGLIAATLATAMAQATLPALAGLVVITIGLWFKARVEEDFLRAELGHAVYDAYRRRVPMLLPFGPK
jgi:protein-S-isoprenylcysteine O-methyltransferase Ste14